MKSPVIICLASAPGEVVTTKTMSATGRSRSDTRARRVVTNSPFITCWLSSADNPMSVSIWSAVGSARAGLVAPGTYRASTTTTMTSGWRLIGPLARRRRRRSRRYSSKLTPARDGWRQTLPLVLKPPYRDLLDGAEVKLAGPEQRKPIHFDKAVESRDEEIRQSGGRQLLHDWRQGRLIERMQYGEPLALALVRHARDGEDLRTGPCGVVQGVLDATMRDHLATDLGEPRQAIDDTDEPVVIDHRDVPVTYQPSRTTSAVRSGRPRYPCITFGPLMRSIPGV